VRKPCLRLRRGSHAAVPLPTTVLTTKRSATLEQAWLAPIQSGSMAAALQIKLILFFLPLDRAFALLKHLYPTSGTLCRTPGRAGGLATELKIKKERRRMKD